MRMPCSASFLPRRKQGGPQSHFVFKALREAAEISTIVSFSSIAHERLC
jgi:hypothetical protein